LNRRTLLSATALLGLAGCGIVTTNTTNNVTTVTVNVAKINQYAQAFAAGVATVLGVPGVSALMGQYLAPFTAIENAVVTDIAAFNAATGGAATLTFDASSVPASITSILNDGKNILTTIQTALPQTALIGTLMDAVNAVQTIVLLFEALLPAATVSAPLLPMPEAKALAVLGVK
jgi:uncharacterized protein YceK